ncbi:hypothetical protein LTR36_001827 [Oleoguttula mirabilis]|uniref:Uncharacterized protein n=1 Tax=Oleoguttula mirabilis TaxID=1507867 RepID=A0AAV9JMN8_9PEZI|nr:hypothetical protein LTR36_001827 [Oleoguttula mirabilis]
MPRRKREQQSEEPHSPASKAPRVEGPSPLTQYVADRTLPHRSRIEDPSPSAQYALESTLPHRQRHITPEPVPAQAESHPVPDTHETIVWQPSDFGYNNSDFGSEGSDAVTATPSELEFRDAELGSDDSDSDSDAAGAADGTQFSVMPDSDERSGDGPRLSNFRARNDAISEIAHNWGADPAIAPRALRSTQARNARMGEPRAGVTAESQGLRKYDV